MSKMQTTSGETVEILMRDLRGRKVKTRRDMKNGWMTIPAGTKCVVDTATSWGIGLTSDPCPHCKVSISISKIKRHDLLLVDVAAELYFQFEVGAEHTGVHVEVRCKKHLSRDAKVVDSEEDRRRHKDSWLRTREYHSAHGCSKCLSRAEEQK